METGEVRLARMRRGEEYVGEGAVAVPTAVKVKLWSEDY